MPKTFKKKDSQEKILPAASTGETAAAAKERKIQAFKRELRAAKLEQTRVAARAAKRREEEQLLAHKGTPEPSDAESEEDEEASKDEGEEERLAELNKEVQETYAKFLAEEEELKEMEREPEELSQDDSDDDRKISATDLSDEESPRAKTELRAENIFRAKPELRAKNISRAKNNLRAKNISRAKNDLPAETDLPAENSPDKVFKFALSPAAAVTGPLDLKDNKSHARIYERACEPLTGKRFDLTEANLQTFLKQVSYKSCKFQWDGLFSISKKEDLVNKVPNPKVYNLVQEYGKLTIADVKVKTETFSGKPVRMAQDDMMLFNCLMASITDAARNRVQLMDSEFKLKHGYSGICLLRTLIRESHIDNRATERILLTKLANLDEYMDAVGHDIEKFNHYVMNTIDSLASRGSKAPHDLLHSLFKGYMNAKDKAFTSYIQLKRNTYDEGDNSITVQSLMQLASAKYKALVQSNDWQAPTAAESELIALKAQVSSQKKELKDLKSGAKKESRRQRVKKDNTKQEAHKARKSLVKTSNRAATKGANWKYEKPPPHLLRTPVTDARGTRFWWCSKETGGKCHGMFRAHKPKDCRGANYRPDATSSRADKGRGYSKKDSSKKKKKSILKAMLAQINQMDSDDSDSDDSDVEMDDAQN